MRLSQVHPVFYKIAVVKNIIQRYLIWIFSTETYCSQKREDSLPFQVFEHQLPILRRLGSVDMRLQENKKINLQIMGEKLNGTLIRPGETFSLWKLTGRISKRKGYKEGLILKGEEVSSGKGGGVCQLSNLLHWMVLHSPMVIREQHHHSLDFFPDNKRRIPFGTGAAIMYNYLDYSFFNPTENTFQIRIVIEDNFLKGFLYSDNSPSVQFRLEERNHYFFERENRFFRNNEIWKCTIDSKGASFFEEKLYNNRAKVLYDKKFIPKDQIKML